MRNRQLKDSTMFSALGWIGIIISVILMLVMSCTALQAQNVVFVNSKRQADITIYITSNKWQADTKVKFVKHKWEMGGRNVWRKVRRNYPGAMKIYVTNNKWEADRIVWYAKYLWQINSNNPLHHRGHHCHPRLCRVR
jgi:hypothetical protein